MWYELKLIRDDNDTFLVTAPAFPEVTTFADSKDHASEIGSAAVREAIARRIADGESLPPPLAGQLPRKCLATVQALTYLKMALYMKCRSKRVTRAELARRLDWHREQVDRLFRLDHKSQLDQIEQAFNAIGDEISFDMDFPQAA